MASLKPSALGSGVIRLPVWDQIAGRDNITTAHCFPFDTSLASQDEAVAHLRDCLENVTHQRKDFAAKLSQDQKTGRVYLHHTEDAVPFTVYELGDKFPYTYDQLRAKEFTPAAFVHIDFLIDGTLSENPIPVCQVRVSFIEGGMILWIYLHHTFTDGDGLRIFIDYLSGQTRGLQVHHPQDLTFEPPQANIGGEELNKACPEYSISPAPPPKDHAGPRATPMFVFRNDRLDELKAAIAKPASPDMSQKKKTPSTYVTLAALTFAHATKARLASSGSKPTDSKDPAKLIISIDWKTRAFQPQAKTYYGNAVAIPLTDIPISTVLPACSDPRSLSTITQVLEGMITSIDDDFVSTRTAWINVIEDPRSFRYNIDFIGNPRHYAFNTWRFIGADSEWSIPGVGGCVTPDAIRPVRGELGAGFSLIMPGKRASGAHEVVMYLPVKAVDVLVKDESFMQWVDHVV